MSESGPAAPAPKRPKAVTVIGWVWLGVGIARTLATAAGLAAWRFGGARPPWVSRLLPEPLAARMELVLFLELLSGLFFLYAGYELLRLRPWARGAIEILSWVGLVFVALSIAAWLLVCFFLPAPPEWMGIRVGLAAAGLAVGGALAWMFAAMIRSLRDAAVRQAFARP